MAMDTTLTMNPTRNRTAAELPTEMLERFRSRAGELDRSNSYFDEDLVELRAAGYLAAAVPTRYGDGASIWPGWPRASGASPATPRRPRWR